MTEEFLPVLLKTAETLRICGLSAGSETSKEDEVRNLSITLVIARCLLKYQKSIRLLLDSQRSKQTDEKWQ